MPPVTIATFPENGSEAVMGPAASSTAAMVVHGPPAPL